MGNVDGDSAIYEDNGTDKIYYSYGVNSELISLTLDEREY